jgi:hypothetical protein
MRELTPLTLPNVITGSSDHHRLLSIGFLVGRSLPQIPKRRSISSRMHSRKTIWRTLNTVRRTPLTTHNNFWFVWIINQARIKLAEKVNFLAYILQIRMSNEMLTMPEVHRCSNQEGSLNSRRNRDDAKQMSHRGPTNIRRHCTKFSRHGDLAPRICATLDYTKRPVMSFLNFYRKARDRNLK